MWDIIVLILWVIAWNVAEAIPLFNDLLSRICVLFASWFINNGRYNESPGKMVFNYYVLTTEEIVRSGILCLGEGHPCGFEKQ